MLAIAQAFCSIHVNGEPVVELKNIKRKGILKRLLELVLGQ